MPAKRYGTKRAYGLKGNVAIMPYLPVFLAAGLAVDFDNASPGDPFVGTTTLGADARNQPDEAVRIEVDYAETKYTNSGDINPAHIGSAAYFADINTLSIDSATESRLSAGTITQVDDDGVWVAVG